MAASLVSLCQGGPQRLRGVAGTMSPRPQAQRLPLRLRVESGVAPEQVPDSLGGTVRRGAWWGGGCGAGGGGPFSRWRAPRRQPCALDQTEQGTFPGAGVSPASRMRLPPRSCHCLSLPHKRLCSTYWAPALCQALEPRVKWSVGDLPPHWCPWLLAEADADWHWGRRPAWGATRR